MEAIKTRAQVADEYGISVRTFHTWLRQSLPELRNKTLTPIYQKRIYETFGYPFCVSPQLFVW